MITVPGLAQYITSPSSGPHPCCCYNTVTLYSLSSHPGDHLMVDVPSLERHLELSSENRSSTSLSLHSRTMCLSFYVHLWLPSFFSLILRLCLGRLVYHCPWRQRSCSLLGPCFQGSANMHWVNKHIHAGCIFKCVSSGSWEASVKEPEPQISSVWLKQSWALGSIRSTAVRKQKSLGLEVRVPGGNFGSDWAGW